MNTCEAGNNESRQQIRGSSLLLAGRLFALLLNLLTQVLTVRYLAKTDYGAFAFAISAVELVACLSMLGLNKTCSRFLPIYHEQRDYERTLGTLVMLVSTVLGVGTACVLTVIAGRGLLVDYVVSDQLSLTLLLTLIALAPIDALDFILEAFFGAFGTVRVVLFRRHVLGPSLKLSAVATVLWWHGSVQTLAVCHLIAGLLGFSFYVPSLIRVLRQQRLLDGSLFRRLRFPVAEVCRFSGPLLGSHIVFLCQGAVIVLLLEMLSGSSDVAEYRAVLPFARLNSVVHVSFSLLFTPLAARFLSRGQGGEISQLYWDSVTWITILSFPIFALTAVFSSSLSVFMLGDDYAGAGGVMTLLAIGFFLDATLGLSGQALRVYARVRLVLLADILATVCGMTLMFLLIPRYGALGAALANMVFLATEHTLYLWFTHAATDVKTCSRQGLKIYVSVAAGILLLVVVKHYWHPDMVKAVLLIAVTGVALVLWHREKLAIGRVYPEIARIPLVGRLLAVDRSVAVGDPGRVVR